MHGCIYSQGLFLKRQPEVSAEFADCMTEKLLASETLWAAVLTGSKADKFAEILRGRMRTFMRGTAAVLYGGSDPTEFAGAEWWGALEARVSERTMELLPSELPRVHGYVDTALGLREDLNVNLRRLSPAEFEQASRRMCPMPSSIVHEHECLIHYVATSSDRCSTRSSRRRSSPSSSSAQHSALPSAGRRRGGMRGAGASARTTTHRRPARGPLPQRRRLSVILSVCVNRKPGTPGPPRPTARGRIYTATVVL